MNMHFKICFSIFVWIFLLLPHLIFGQYLKNPSLEGTPINGGQQPNEWLSQDDWSDPDLNFDYTPYNSGKTYYPVDSNVFALYRSRGTTYNETWHGPRQREYSYQQLLKPLEPFSCFKFEAYLAFNEHHEVNDLNPDLVNRAFPLKFQLWGGNSANSREILLLESEVIDDSDWKKHTYFFHTDAQQYSWILFEVQWDTIRVRSEPYNGMMFIDDLSLERIGPLDIVTNDTIYYHGDGNTQLTAQDGNSFVWSPGEYLSGISEQSLFILEYHPDFTVIVDKGDECPVMEKFHVLLNCDSMYPDEYFNNRDVYYKYEKNIYLDASPGFSYSWEPQVNLSAYNVQSPYMTDYNENYIVTVSDKYNCSFKELFHIVLQCDTLYPDKSILILDTLLEDNQSINLLPRYGWPASEWNPSRFLSCTDCGSPIATPEVATNYSISLEDNFGCVHEELFYLDVKLEIPNVITPNEDGFNDCLKIIGLPENSYLYIYTKNGELLFSADPYSLDNNCWKGTDRSDRLLETGTYWYILGHKEYGTLQTGYILVKL